MLINTKAAGAVLTTSFFLLGAAPRAVVGQCSSADNCNDCTNADVTTPSQANFCTWFEDIGFCEEGCGLDGCGASICAADIFECDVCLGGVGSEASGQYSWVPETQLCYGSCMEAPADASCYKGKSSVDPTGYDPEICETFDTTVPPDNNLPDTGTCPSGDDGSGECDYSPINPHVCGPDYSCSYATICELEMAGYNLEQDCCQAPQESSCGFIFDPLVCGSKECPYSNLCLAELSGYTEEQCEPPEEQCPVSDSDCGGDPVNPFTCGSLKCPYEKICELEGAGFDVHECCQDTRVFSECTADIQPVSCGSPGGKQCGYDNQCLANDAGYNENQCCGSVPDDTVCIYSYAPVECGPLPCVYSNQCEASAAGHSESDCCPQADGACSLIYDPVVCGDGDCAYSSQSCADLAGFTSDQCSSINAPDCDGLASCADCLDGSCAWSPDSGTSGACLDSCDDAPADSPCYSPEYDHTAATCPAEPACPQGDGACSQIYDPVVCGDDDCTYDSQSCADLAGFTSDQCSRVNCPQGDGACSQIYDPVVCGDSCVYDSQSCADLAGFSSGQCANMNVPDCYGLASCADCLDGSCAWSPDSGTSGLCLDSCDDAPADSPCYSPEYDHTADTCPDVVALVWEQSARPLLSDTTEDYFGSNNNFDTSGTRFLVSASKSSASANEAGMVKVYDYANNNFYQVGQELYGFSAGDEVQGVLSGSGTRLCVFSNRRNNHSGRVWIYELKSDQWVEIGTIGGDTVEARFGQTVAINEAGDTIAVSSSYYDNKKGRVQVFKDMGGSVWDQIGDDILGLYKDGKFGWDIDIATNDLTMVIGEKSDDVGRSGEVRVFRWNGNAQTFEQVGNTILGDSVGDSFGRQVSIDASGETFAAGSRYYDSPNGDDSGGIKAYSNSGGTWSQVPFDEADIIGDGPGDGLQNNAMNAAGDRIAGGGGGGGDREGYVRVYDKAGDGWVAGNKLTGQILGEGFGSNVDISQDGTRLLVGSPARDNDNLKAAVRIYELVPAGTYNYPHDSTEASSAADDGAGTLAEDGSSTSSALKAKATASVVATLVAAAFPAAFYI